MKLFKKGLANVISLVVLQKCTFFLATNHLMYLKFDDTHRLSPPMCTEKNSTLHPQTHPLWRLGTRIGCLPSQKGDIPQTKH